VSADPAPAPGALRTHGPTAALLLLMVASLYAVFQYVPTEREMGLVQRIFYFHVASAIASFTAFFLVFVAGIGYLRSQGDGWDRLGQASAELGVTFAVIVLITGPIWARPIWGVYWRWEPRLTIMLITFCIYVAYLMVRAYGDPGPQTKRFAAAVGIIAFVCVPLVRYSVNLWSEEQQLHPVRIDLDPRMLHTRYLTYAAFAVLFAYVLRLRLSQLRAAQRLEEVEAHLEDTLAAGGGPR
jgi:heme exporter protein C